MEHKIRTLALSTTLALIFTCSANAASLIGNVNKMDKQQEVSVNQLDFTGMYDNQDDYEDDC
jgi:hypothetical protein